MSTGNKNITNEKDFEWGGYLKVVYKTTVTTMEVLLTIYLIYLVVHGFRSGTISGFISSSLTVLFLIFSKYFESKEDENKQEEEQEQNDKPCRFVEISYDEEEDLEVFMDTETKLLYMRSCGDYGDCIAPLLNKDGKQMEGDLSMIQKDGDA